MEPHELSQYVYEHIIASHYSWSLESIRAMDAYDFNVHLRICMERESIQNEYQALLAGATPSEDVEHENITSQPKVVSTKKLASGGKVETTTEKAMSFKSSVKKVRINKKGEYIGDA